jgi:hypothetical protein
MKASSDTERVRQYSSKQYIEPARKRGDVTVRIVAGDVHNAVHLSNRVPLVCQALESRKFIEENGLELEKVEGPPSGRSTTAAFTYRIKASGTTVSAETPEWPFLRLRGIAKDVFRSLGGGEEFIRNEREQFYRSNGPGEKS